ncbi:MAG TPA: hypothetical protein VLY82_03155 [Nitrososphaerales archaeon]|nr:hypothetical protein [Nitrososphaerales archaeon]
MPGYASPLVLGTQLTIQRGQLLQFSAQPLAPRVLVPYEINEIRFCAYPSIETASAFIGATSALRGFLKFLFLSGPHPLTDGYVPMWNMMPVRQLTVEYGGYYTWKFKRPFLMAPGQRIDAKVFFQTNAPNVLTTPIVTVALAYAGRLRADLSSMPASVHVPFVSCWDTSVLDQGGQGITPFAGQALRNPLANPITVEMLIGRFQDDTTGLDSASDANQLNIQDPHGRWLVQNGPADGSNIFPPDTRSFPYQGQLAYNAHFSARLSIPPSPTYRPMISYLGSRREMSA